MTRVEEIMPDLNFDTPTFSKYYPTGVDSNCGNGDDD